jgi:hypothetical protein
MKKKNLVILLWINTVLEVGVGLAFWIYPGAVSWFPDTFGSLDPASDRLILSMYGTAALCMGLLSLLMIRKPLEEDLLKSGILLFGLFHLGLSLALFAFSHDPRPALLHLALSLAFAWHWISITRNS